VAANWSLISNSWFTQEYTTGVSKDLSVDYRVGPYSTATADRACSFQIWRAITAPDLTVSYAVQSSAGVISGTPMLVYGSAQADFSAVSKVFSTATADRVCQYLISNAAENTLSPSYRVLNSATKDLTPSYIVGGAVVKDLSAAYAVKVEAIADFADSYRILTSAQADRAVTFAIVTVTPTAGANLSVTYQITSAVQQNYSVQYGIFNATQQDSPTATYRILGSAQVDWPVVYAIDSSASRDLLGSYVILREGPVTKDYQFRYAISATSVRVPNIVGFPLSKARKVLQQSGLRLGQISYS
jgi:hypothetical protein